jgi:sugar phosphate permease
MDATMPIVRGVDPLERETMRKVTFRLMPIVMLGYFCCFLDRVNVGMAALTMNKQFGFSSAVFGFGAGLFFFGYFLAQLPSNLILNKVGARRWVAPLLAAWGIVSAMTAFVTGEYSFYAIRLLIGLAEAGFFPGMVLYMTWWFPSAYRSRILALLYTSTMISLIIGPPISALLLHMDGLGGLFGWQWLFILEAAPAVVMGVVTWHLLTDKPTDAAWLRPEQRTWLGDRLASERAQREAVRKYSLAQALLNPKVWLLTLAYFLHNFSEYALTFFLPLIIRGLGVSSSNMIGLLSALPYVFALVALNYWGWHSDRSGERTWHLASALILCGIAMAACIVIGPAHPVWLFVSLLIAVTSTWAVPSIFWSLPTALLTGTAAAGGIALISSIGNMGGWIGPWVFGLVKDATGSDNIALLVLASGTVISGIIVIALGHDRRLERIPPHQ